MHGKEAADVSEGVRQTDPCPGPHSPIGCEAHLDALRDKNRVVHAALTECAAENQRLVRRVGKLERDNGKLRSRLGASTGSLGLRSESELALLRRARDTVNEVLTTMLVEGEMLVRNAPSYEDEDDSSS